MTLKEWLERADCYDTAEVLVVIGDETYEGVRYKQDRPTPPGSRAQMEGRDSYTQEAIYLLGVAHLEDRVALVMPGDEREWFLASEVTEETARDPRYAEFHFEGKAAFQIMPWSIGKIDDHEFEPYQRLGITVREVAAA
jgi:hypothetical protein